MTCEFERLVFYLDGKLSLDERLETLNHLDGCANCFETIYQLSRDRDDHLFVSRPFEPSDAIW
jgi:anti-sigma factor RsiW